jgi:hypothetical protein
MQQNDRRHAAEAVEIADAGTSPLLLSVQLTYLGYPGGLNQQQIHKTGASVKFSRVTELT